MYHVKHLYQKIRDKNILICTKHDMSSFKQLVN